MSTPQPTKDPQQPVAAQPQESIFELNDPASMQKAFELVKTPANAYDEAIKHYTQEELAVVKTLPNFVKILIAKQIVAKIIKLLLTKRGVDVKDTELYIYDKDAQKSYIDLKHPNVSKIVITPDEWESANLREFDYKNRIKKGKIRLTDMDS